MDVIALAKRIADGVLFPAALGTDTADTLPRKLLDTLADAGFYGLSGPRLAGGLEADFPTITSVIETLASGCLTTTFVWAQHMGVLIPVAASENSLIREWVAPLCSGARRAGLALGGALPGSPKLTARETQEGWTFDGISPFVSGWNRIDAIHTAARTEDGRLVWALVDARESQSLSVQRLELVALNSTATVAATFHHHAVPSERVTSVSPYRPGPAPPELLRIHASFSLGVVQRCCRLLGPTALDDELATLRAELDKLDATTIEGARGAAGELAIRSAAALAVAAGSRSLLRAHHAQRLLREAVFGLVYALRPGVRSALLKRYTGSGALNNDELALGS